MPAELTTHRRCLDPVQGRDEVNLIDFPIATLRHQQPVGRDGTRPDEMVCVIESYDSDLQKTIPRKLTRRTASRYGFPTPLEEEVLIALLSLSRHRNEFTEPRVEFRNGKVLELMGWPQNGTSTRRLAVALDRLTGLTLKYENSWSTTDGVFAKEFTTGILESYSLTKQTRGRRRPDSERSWIQWSSEVFADIRRGNVRELNTHQYFALRLPISRRMYRFLDRRLSESTEFEMELSAFSVHLGLSELKHVGKIKERLALGLKELESVPGFMKPRPASERYRKRGPGDWLIGFERSRSETRMKHLPSAGRDSHRTSRPVNSAAASLVAEFYQQWAEESDHRATRKELQLAEEILDRYGPELHPKLHPLVLRDMKKEFAAARTFGATRHFWSKAAKSITRLQVRDEREQSAARQESTAAASRDFQRERNRKQLQQWRAMSSAQQRSILKTVRDDASPSVQRLIDQKKLDDPLVRIHCLKELESRNGPHQE